MLILCYWAFSVVTSASLNINDASSASPLIDLVRGHRLLSTLSENDGKRKYVEGEFAKGEFMSCIVEFYPVLCNCFAEFDFLVFHLVVVCAF